MELSDEVSSLKGVGKEVERKLKKLGIESISDLIHYYPRRYDDFSNLTPINKLKPGTVSIKGKILRAVTRRTRRRGFSITEAIIDDGSGAVKAVWFNQPYLAKGLPKDTEVYVSGELQFNYNQFAMQNPVVERASDFPKNTARIVPVYSETAGLSSRQLRSLIEQVLPVIKKIPDDVPPEVIKAERLVARAEALQNIHFPASAKSLEQAIQRLGFEELFLLILTGLIIKSEIKTEKAPRIKFVEKMAKEFSAALPFKLTGAQRIAAWRILQDLDSQRPMNRLLEGDVGSGKTMVSAMAAYMAIHNGYQVAMMAPTEILAQQHFKTLSTLSNRLRYSVIYLSGSLKKLERDKILQKISNGKAAFIVGTHALLQPEVEFKNLGLVVIDEQHRFGVNQRQQLKAKAHWLPHLLSMSATPIPRSLALTVYGDLDISVLDELPPGRQAVDTKVVVEADRAKAYAHVDKEIAAGRQVYVVCPLISESDKLGVKSVEAESQRLKKSVFAHRHIGVLNGRMKPVEKQAIMDKFSQGEVDILVSTTVVEVGVDVANASVMLIEGAERFGLASLHQLRGRVGRGRRKSYCYLLTSNDHQAKARLQLLAEYNDGFILAQKDLEMRGPGAIYGHRQHGLLDLRIANLSDAKLITRARTAAEAFMEQPANLLKYRQLITTVNKLKNITTLD